MSVIEVQDLRKAYDDVKAVDGVSFTVEIGEVFGMLGPNGAGKTTTVEIMEGLRPRDSGAVRVLGLDPGREAGDLKRKIGVQLQQVSLYPRLRVVEVIELFASFYGRAGVADHLLTLLGLEERRRAFVKDLSGGQQQRLSVALAMVNDPPVIFLDEPTTGMDPQARRSLWETIEQ
ncbi:MAG: ABC transporter ATP-binding protein, partial [Acidobacteria bacterium]|nr:ABC transporter ATP-binding protein [Acidobacteriota bacterium]